MALGAAVVQAGFEHVPLGSPSEAELAPVFASLPRLSLEESNAVVMRDVFAGLDARAALQGMSAAVRDWRPQTPPLGSRWPHLRRQTLAVLSAA
jgi:hypothetical protein